MPSHARTQDPPFPPIGTPGEFGRAWRDSLKAADPVRFQQLHRSGALPTLEAEKETEGQELYQSHLEALTRAQAEWETQPHYLPNGLSLQARELAMAQLREEFEETPPPSPARQSLQVLAELRTLLDDADPLPTRRPT